MQESNSFILRSFHLPLEELFWAVDSEPKRFRCNFATIDSTNSGVRSRVVQYAGENNRQ